MIKAFTIHAFTVYAQAFSCAYTAQELHCTIFYSNYIAPSEHRFLVEWITFSTFVFKSFYIPPIFPYFIPWYMSKERKLV